MFKVILGAIFTFNQFFFQQIFAAIQQVRCKVNKFLCETFLNRILTKFFMDLARGCCARNWGLIPASYSQMIFCSRVQVQGIRAFLKEQVFTTKLQCQRQVQNPRTLYNEVTVLAVMLAQPNHDLCQSLAWHEHCTLDHSCT